MGQLEGRIEVLEHRVQRAMEEAKAARVAAQATEPAGEQPPQSAAEEPVSEELQAYRNAYAKWRAGDFTACIDQFQTFVKTYPTSDYADDATYGMGECYFQKDKITPTTRRTEWGSATSRKTTFAGPSSASMTLQRTTLVVIKRPMRFTDKGRR
jgi:TolA-binding protein